MKEHVDGDIWLVYNFRGVLLVVCDSKEDAEEYIRRQNAEDNALFYYEKWGVTYYE